MTSKEIRQQFLDFFKERGHAIVPSAPVVPLDDPTLLFTNAGMNQFKDVFLGTGSRSYTRAADTQKCIRAGGKHNDLDDVGIDTYHHTFFEMLGNWSFGDYFKKEAIEWGWELLTKVWGIDKTRLHATYFEGRPDAGLEPDNETRDLWTSVTDIDPAHVHPGSMKDNFWEMGDTGPCGPCSEIHIDLTPDKSGGPLVNAGDHRVIELWNLVFIQFNRGADGKLTPLSAKHVDTGLGFERLCAVLQGKESNYDTDVWTPIFDTIQKRTNAPDYKGTLHPQSEPSPERQRRDVAAGVSPAGDTQHSALSTQHSQLMIDVSYRIIADHVRCLTFALTDGAVPSNEGRGYVLRRILRRAVRFGRQYFDMHEPFLCDLVPPLVDHMADAFPELHTAHGGRNVQHVAELIHDEEESFGRTLDRGIGLFEEAADYATKRHHGVISGEDAFKLHDTYGFPIDLTELMARERGLSVDLDEYERLMEEARERAKSVHTIEVPAAELVWRGLEPTIWSVPSSWNPTDDNPKYDGVACNAKILGWFTAENKGKEEPPLQEGEAAALVLEKTSFYVEQGGQVGDTGTIETDTGAFDVQTTKWGAQFVLHGGVVKGTIKAGQVARVMVDRMRRAGTTKNHTATHMLNWALREVLGEGVQQKGSLVDHEKTRFDFSRNKPLTIDELTRVETLVNEKIEAGLPVYTKEVEQAKAREISTLRAVFGEQYPDVVRVVSVGADIDEMLADPKNPRWMQYAVEFCGGTHLSNSAEAERFALVSEEAVAKGIRRVVGVTGKAAREARAAGLAYVGLIQSLDEAPLDDLAERLPEIQRNMAEVAIPVHIRQRLRDHVAELQKRVKERQKSQAAASGEAVRNRVAGLLDAAETIDGVTIVVGEVPSAKPDALRGAIDWVRNKTEASAVLLATASDDKVTLIAGMSKAVVKRGLKAGDLIREVAPLVGGKGGGRPDMAQGGGNDPARINDALQSARGWIAGKLR